MSIQLKNDTLCLELNKPGKVYQGSRFDWTGQIVQITYLDKHTFCTKELKDEKSNKIQGQGLYNEFGIDMPVGYYTCCPGDQFPKIGVGQLTKKYDISYDFFNPYQIDPYQLYPNKFENYLNPNSAVRFSKSSLTWKSVPQSAFFFSRLNTGYQGSASWTLVQIQDKVAIKESVDFKIHKMNLWGQAHVVSPEIFALIHVRPGRNYSWKRKYEFFRV